MRGLLRIANTMVWCWIALSNILAPVATEGDFWIEKGRQLFRLGPVDDMPRLLGRAVIPFALWLLCDWIIRHARKRMTKS
jgi:hypothetical protein